MNHKDTKISKATQSYFLNHGDHGELRVHRVNFCFGSRRDEGECRTRRFYGLSGDIDNGVHDLPGDFAPFDFVRR